MGIATPTAEVINECSQVKVVVSMKARNSSFSFKWLLDDGNGYVRNILSAKLIRLVLLIRLVAIIYDCLVWSFWQTQTS